MKEYNCDLHFHSPYAAGVSKNMLIPVIAEQGKLKGLNVVSTSDITHGKWFNHVKDSLIEESNGVFKDKKVDTYFIIGTEVQCSGRVHHLIFLPDFSAAENLKKSMEGKAIFDSWGCGRPRIRPSAEEIAEKVFDVGGIIGPAHAFTPYFSVYAHFDSLEKCYGSMEKKINFIELGLSADSYLADLIEGNHKYNFLTASDSHSPWPHRVGREFTRIKMKEPKFSELKKAFEKKEEKLLTLNVGLDPREGKYHCTACNACFEKYSMKQAEQLNWRCIKCKGIIKKGVGDRIAELASYTKETHPEFRPKYVHGVPLAELVQIVLGVKNVNAQKVQLLWAELVDRFENEINILIDVPVEEISKVNEKVAEAVNAMRNGYVLYIPGGGGNYGTPVICKDKEEFEKKKIELRDQLQCSSSAADQKTLGEF